MAQLYLPEYPCERERLQSSVSASACPLTPSDAELFSSVEERGIFRLEAPETREEA
jgi:hypothetical protein